MKNEKERKNGQKMEFRPCIDIHNGRVKQIVGASLQDAGNTVKENFVAEQGADYYARLYRDAGIRGGHVILLNARDSGQYAATKEQALSALRAYPCGLQVGGGITPESAPEFLEAGASHVIVTSYVFRGGQICYDRLERMRNAVGSKKLVLDLSCQKVGEEYRIVTDRWQRVTEERVDQALLAQLSEYCDEFLVHAVDVEGKAGGIERELAAFLGAWDGKTVTYAGGVHSYEDLELLKVLGKGRLNVTIGSALDLFGGKLSWEKVLDMCKKAENNC